MKEQRNFIKGIFRAVRGDVEGATGAFREFADAKLQAEAETPAERAVAHLLMHRYEDALGEADIGVAQSSGGSLYVTRARILLALGAGDEAFADVRSALERGTPVPPGDGLVGMVLLAQGSLDRAIDALEADARASSPEPAALYALGDAYRLGGRAADATPPYEAAADGAAADRVPDLMWGRALGAMAMAKAGHLEEARKLALEMMTRFPNDPFARIARAYTDLRLGSPALAADDLERAEGIACARVAELSADPDLQRQTADDRVRGAIARATTVRDEILVRIRSRPAASA